MAKPYHRILITGTAGRFGSELREGLASLAHQLRLADRIEISDLRDNE